MAVAMRSMAYPRGVGFTGMVWLATRPPPYFAIRNGIAGSSPTRARGYANVGAPTLKSDLRTGHITCGSDENLLFLDNIFPLKLRWMMRLPFFKDEESIDEAMKRFKDSRFASMDPMNLVKQALPESLPLTVTQLVPRIKDGGVFVKFRHQKETSLTDVEQQVQQHLEDNPLKPMYSPLNSVRACLVRGTPWIEDLYRFPTPRIRVAFLTPDSQAPAKELTQEQLFAIFRRYGKIADFTAQPTESKDLPRYALCTFESTRTAIMAKACVHGMLIDTAHGGGPDGTVLRITYEKIIKAHWIRDWIAGHSRLVIPLLAALAAAITVAIFDPIRTWFIKMHVTAPLHSSNNKLLGWLKSQASRANDLLKLRFSSSSESGLKVIWDDRKSDLEQIRTWLMETTSTFIVVQGPRGSGKRELVVDEALKGRKDTLVIDCKPIQEARGDSATISAAAKQVGYRPVLSWTNSVNSLIDLAAQGTIGTKTGLSDTLDNQLAKIFQLTSSALQTIALSQRRKTDPDYGIGADEYLDQHPEVRPVVVIDNFLHKSNLAENDLVYDKIAEWAANLTTANIAHFIFLTHDVSFSKSLGKALPDRVFRQVSLGDASPDLAKRYVLRQLDADVTAADAASGEKHLKPSEFRKDLSELDGSIGVLGGRLTDLESLARRIKAGESPHTAVDEIIEQSAAEIMKMYIFDQNRAAGQWSPPQAWALIKALGQSETDSIRFNELLLGDLWKNNGSSALRALEAAELITIVSANGRPRSIKPGRPVYQAAFRSLLSDSVLNAQEDLATLGELTKIETANITSAESELAVLGGLPRQPFELGARVQYLLSKVATSQKKIEGYDRKSDRLKKVLQKEF